MEFILPYQNSRPGLFYERLAKTAFFIYLVFVIFGTSMPFQEKITDVTDIETSNPLKQLLFPLLFIAGLVSLIPCRRQAIGILKSEKFLALFFLWALVTVSWSNFPFISLKRWIQVVGPAIISLGILMHSDSAEEVKRYFRIILAFYISISLVSVFIVPGAVHSDMAAWKGLASHKNTLGQISLVAAIFWFDALKTDSWKKKIVSSALLLMSVVLLIGSHSMTSFLNFAVWLFLMLLFGLDKLFRPLNIGRFYSFFIFFIIIVLVVSTVFFVPNVKALFFDFMGKDATFTGRMELWQAVFDHAKENIFTGCGFAGFWIVGNRPVMDLFDFFIWLPNEAHQGYLDILNETGLVGLGLFILLVVFYAVHLPRLKKPHLWKWFVLLVLIINFFESTLFVLNNVTGVLFTFSYLALFTEIHKERSF